MKKSILSLGSALNRAQQKEISGGFGPLKPSRCCDPAMACCTTSSLAQNNSSCGGSYRAGCRYHHATNCCI